jgi:uncharacterized protein (UPF0218 family)
MELYNIPIVLRIPAVKMSLYGTPDFVLIVVRVAVKL